MNKYFVVFLILLKQPSVGIMTNMPKDMWPRIDWDAEEKERAWETFKEKIQLYFTVAKVP